jgi:hypothetical protein
MKSVRTACGLIVILLAAACSGSDAVLIGNSVTAASAAVNPPLLRGVDGIPGWTRTGPPERYNKEGLYGYIDGGAEIVLQYGFREVAVSEYRPAGDREPAKEITLEIYRMTSGQAAFGLYSTKLEGEESGWPAIEADNWITPGQASFVKGEYLVNILGPECGEKELGEFMAAVEPKVPGRGTVRPEGLDRLPRDGQVRSSRRYIRGPLAAQNESPFLEGEFWGFDGAPDEKGATEAFSAKYGAAPLISKLVVVELGTPSSVGSIDDEVLAAFEEYLTDVGREGALVEGRNQAGRWFLFERRGAIAALVLGDPDRAAAVARLGQALGPATERMEALSMDRPKTFLVVTFDTEDTISPESEKIDDIPKWLAETMTEEGVTGTFFVIGEKARSLEARGRRDVIEAMARHDIGSHTNFGSIHPTVTERLEKAGWDDGVRLMFEQESAGIRELERIFGVPVTMLARHGGSYGPQLVAALGRLGAGYQISPASLPGHDVVWFCNTLNFSAQYSGFDDAYYRDDLFEPVFDKLKAELPGVIRKSQVLALFAGHPTKIRAEEFWDLNFYGGRNTPPDKWRMPRLRPRETMATARKNFRRMMRWLKGRDDIEITTYRDLLKVYARQKETITREDMRNWARMTLENEALAPTADLSPAEAFAGLAAAVARFRREGALPPSLAALHPLGPKEMPPAAPGTGRVTLDEAIALARGAAGHIERTGALPSCLESAGGRIGVGSLAALFCAVYLDLDSGKHGREYGVPAFEPYPSTHEREIIGVVDGYKTWPVHRPDLDMSRIVELTKLQLWTLKPARRRQGVPPERR